MSFLYNNIALTGKPDSHKVLSTAQQVITILQELQLSILLEEPMARALGQKALIATEQDIINTADVIIAIGGDGSILRAATQYGIFNKKLIGINRGTLGFLTEISPNKQLPIKLKQLLKNKGISNKRFLLENKITNPHQHTTCKQIALNDIVLRAGDVVHMIDFEIRIDGQHVYNQRSDGVIITTPTGSTAYALSAGGNIMHPDLDAIAIVPVSPHALTFRPIVVPATKKIEIKINHHHPAAPPLVSADGNEGVNVKTHDTINIQKSEKQIEILQPRGQDFFASCRSKLNWGRPLT